MLILSIKEYNVINKLFYVLIEYLMSFNMQLLTYNFMTQTKKRVAF